jgi:DEAD/DEAH box helicase domain-containing protein
MSIESALRALTDDPRFAGSIVHRAADPEQPARLAPLPPGLDVRLADALQTLGVGSLYTHQAAAVSAALRGEHVAVVTPAASGKTLCYNVPVLHRLLQDASARALYLYPTKALAQDQLAELRRVVEALELAAALAPGVYDGDTPASHRPRIRDHARILLSNPDMLHAGILPQHARWAAFFANLQVVVIDEMHTYRGVFGSHVANVLRRLRRICAFHGSRPQFLLASATIANPEELAGRLVEGSVTIIGPEQNGAPQGRKEVLLYNPPLLDAALGIRRSITLEAADIAAHFLQHNVQTIVFCPTRLSTELTLTYIRDRSGDSALFSAGSVRGYRGGYLPLERRDIEKGLRQGEVRGVVTTNALELGIDIGRLDAAILEGYPGTIASARQQMGRAGRRQSLSAAILVAGAGATDQYILSHPEYLLQSAPERALINPDNETILAGHLACAAAELPFDASGGLGNAPDVAGLLFDLADAGLLYAGGGRYFWGGEGSPAAFSLRSASPDRVVVQMDTGGEKPAVLGEIDRASAPLFLYEGAVYLHEGTTYLVRSFDWEAGIAQVEPHAVEYYTRPTVGEKVDVIAEKERTPVGDPIIYDVTWGDVRVTSQATGYRMLRWSTHETLGFGVIELPEQVIETQGCWIELPAELVESLRAEQLWLADPNDYGPEWPARRNAVRARDSFRCRSCGVPELPGRQHDVHHLIPFRVFVANPALRPGLSPAEASVLANRMDNLVTLCSSCHRRAEASVRTRTGLEGVAALLSGLAPLFLMCDARDLGRVTEIQSPGSGLPSITIYENVSGGVGYSRQLYAQMPELLHAARELVERCPCENGCPACIGPVPEHEYMLDAKSLTIELLRRLAP